MTPPRAVVFDLGGVLIRWDPVPAVAAAVGEDRARALMSHEEFDFLAWNDAQDRGRTFADAEAEAVAAFPHLAEEVRAYRANFAASLVGELEDTVAILRELHAAGVPLFALTNFSAETFPVAQERFAWLSLFDDVVVSGVEGVGKPDVAVFAVLEQRTGVPLRHCVFVDDSARNVEGARAVGLDAILFTDTGHLRGDLVSRGLPLGPPAR